MGNDKKHFKETRSQRGRMVSLDRLKQSPTIPEPKPMAPLTGSPITQQIVLQIAKTPLATEARLALVMEVLYAVAGRLSPVDLTGGNEETRLVFSSGWSLGVDGQRPLQMLKKAVKGQRLETLKLAALLIDDLIEREREQERERQRERKRQERE